MGHLLFYHSRVRYLPPTVICGFLKRIQVCGESIYLRCLLYHQQRSAKRLCTSCGTNHASAKAGCVSDRRLHCTLYALPIGRVCVVRRLAQLETFFGERIGGPEQSYSRKRSGGVKARWREPAELPSTNYWLTRDCPGFQAVPWRRHKTVG